MKENNINDMQRVGTFVFPSSDKYIGKTIDISVRGIIHQVTIAQIFLNTYKSDWYEDNKFISEINEKLVLDMVVIVDINDKCFVSPVYLLYNQLVKIDPNTNAIIRNFSVVE